MCNYRGKSASAGGAAGHGAGFELVVGDGSAFDGAADQITVQGVGQVTAVEAVGPLSQVARQVLGTHAVMGADKPGFDVAEQGVDDRKEFAGVGAFVLG